MKNIMKAASAATLAAVISLTSFTGASALPLVGSNGPELSNVESVQYRRDRDWRDGQSYRGREGYYNGHRGYRDRRPGYRYQNGLWFPLAAFGAGALIGGAVASQPRYAPEPRYTTQPSAMVSNSHAQWCSERYQTYRAYDNTYVPRAGVRAQCNSPYS